MYSLYRYIRNYPPDPHDPHWNILHAERQLIQLTPTFPTMSEVRFSLISIFILHFPAINFEPNMILNLQINSYCAVLLCVGGCDLIAPCSSFLVRFKIQAIFRTVHQNNCYIPDRMALISSSSKGHNQR